MGKIHDNSIERSSLIKIAIPVAPPSKNPFGSKKPFRPRLARNIAKEIFKNSNSDFFDICINYY
jgi:hypothetical protein